MRKYSTARIVGVTAAALAIGLAGGAPALGAPSGIPLEPMVSDTATVPAPAGDIATGSSAVTFITCLIKTLSGGIAVTCPQPGL